MNRRRFLAWTAAGALGSLAGCPGETRSGDGAGSPSPRGGSASPSGGGSESPSPVRTEPSGRAAAGSPDTPATPTAGDGIDATVAGVDLPIPANELRYGSAKDDIPAIIDPAFAADWSGVKINISDYGNPVYTEPRLEPDDRVIGVTRDGEARAYPQRVLNWHEVVNDTFGGPLLVTYCPLCGSSLTAERTVNGQETVFGVSGLLWKSDLVMYDELTGSYWSQIAATAIHGPETGTRMSLVPSTFTTWETWRGDHPDTEVLLPSPESNTVGGRVIRDYRVNPYSDYEEDLRAGLDGIRSEDGIELHPKTEVLGITSDGTAKAYPVPDVRTAGVVNDTVGSLPVVVAVASDDTTLAGYVRRVDGETLRFRRVSEEHLAAGGSRWAITSGRAIDGPYEGTTLEHATNEPQMMWFAWRGFHSGTERYTVDDTDTTDETDTAENTATAEDTGMDTDTAD